MQSKGESVVEHALREHEAEELLKRAYGEGRAASFTSSRRMPPM